MGLMSDLDHRLNTGGPLTKKEEQYVYNEYPGRWLAWRRERQQQEDGEGSE